MSDLLSLEKSFSKWITSFMHLKRLSSAKDIANLEMKEIEGNIQIYDIAQDDEINILEISPSPNKRWRQIKQADWDDFAEAYLDINKQLRQMKKNETNESQVNQNPKE